MADRSQPSNHRSPIPRMREIPAHARFQVAVGAPFRHPLAPIHPPEQPTLLPLIGVNDEIIPALERTLQPIAERAKSGDHAARDALFASFQPKIMRFVRGIRVPFAPDGTHGIWERDDVAQEAYLVFLGIIDSWPATIPFGRYFLANFPWRLRDAVYRDLARRGIPPRTTMVTFDAMSWTDWIADDAAPATETRVLIDALASSFEPPLDDILRLHILDGLTLTAAAERLGISRRTISRHWRSILIRLRAGP